MQTLIIAIVCYGFIGVVMSMVVAVRRRKSGDAEFSPLWFLADPFGWFLFLLWPVWLAAQVSDFGRETSDSTSSTSPHEEEVRPGMKGKVLTELRPSGQVRIGTKVLSARSSGDIIPHDAAIEVIGVEFGGVVVRKTKQE